MTELTLEPFDVLYEVESLSGVGLPEALADVYGGDLGFEEPCVYANFVATLDGVIFRFGLMLVADPARALSETRRVLRPDGRLVLAVWRGADRNPWISIAGRMLVERSHMPPPEPGAPGIFSLADDARLRGLLEDAGFTVRRLEDVPVRFVYADLDDYVRRARDTGGNFATVWREVSEEERSGMWSELAEAFRPFAVDEGYAFPGVALVAVAVG